LESCSPAPDNLFTRNLFFKNDALGEFCSVIADCRKSLAPGNSNEVIYKSHHQCPSASLQALLPTEPCIPSPTQVPIAALPSKPIAVSPSEPVRPSPSQVPIAVLLSVPIAVPNPAPIAAVIPKVEPIAAPHPLVVSPQAAPLLSIAVHPQITTSLCQGSDLSAVAPEFHPRLHGKLSVMAQPPREVNVAVPASESHRDPLSRTSTPQDTCSDVRVELHRLVTRSSAAYEASSSWEEFVAHCKNPQGDLHPDVKTLPHRAAHLIGTLWRTGATVAMKTEPWSMQRKVEALKRGSHQSANLHQDFLCEEFVDMIHKGQWVLLPAHLVMDKTNLRIIPLGVVPQRDRRPQTICDYSFFSVNLDTVPLAPQESMQFGRALHRVLQQVSDADPRLGPVHLSKIDIADGFYRIGINTNDIPKLGIMLPGSYGEKLVGFPLVLPMGWMQSPPIFTAATETVADLANQKLQDQVRCGPHRLDVVG
jgi:hypothetical protein